MMKTRQVVYVGEGREPSGQHCASGSTRHISGDKESSNTHRDVDGVAREVARREVGSICPPDTAEALAAARASGVRAWAHVETIEPIVPREGMRADRYARG